MIDYNDELKKLTSNLTKELKVATPSAFRVVSYLIQTLLCAGAVVAVAIYGLLNKLADEMEKGQKEQRKNPPPKNKEGGGWWDVPQRQVEKCSFNKKLICTNKCPSWILTLDGTGYCKRLHSKKGW